MFSLLPATCPALLNELVLVLNSTFMGYLLLHCLPPTKKKPAVRTIYVRTYTTTMHDLCDTEENFHSSCRYVGSQLNDLLQDYSPPQNAFAN